MTRRPTRRTTLSVAALLVAGGSAALPATMSSAGAAAATCAPAKHAGGDWPMFGHDYANTRNQPAEKKISPSNVLTLAPAFAFSAKGAGGTGDFTGTPIVKDGCLFVGSNDAYVFAANADTGAKVWTTKLPGGGGINSTPFVGDGQVFVSVSRVGAPYVAALDQRTGRIRWTRQIDDQDGADAFGSPVVHDGVLMVGVSGGSAELSNESTRYAFQGAFVLIETRTGQAKPPGTILKKTWTVQAPRKNSNQGGATVWGTPAIDPAHGIAYVGTGNPYHPKVDSPTADSILKVDLNRHSPTFGRILAHYKGDVEEYTTATDAVPCVDFPGNPAPYYPQGTGACGDLDLDFGASPNLFRDAKGRLVVGAGQKSGVYHAVDATTMRRLWKQTIGVPSAVGGIVGSTAIDGGAIYGPHTIGGYVWSLDRAGGTPRWVSPVADGAHWGNPVTVANGVVYTVDLKGFLDAYDAATGLPLLHRPMKADIGGNDLAASWGGVAVARNTVYATVGITSLSNGYVIGYRPGGSGGNGGGGGSGGGGGGSGGGGAPSSPSNIVAGAQAQFYGYLTPVVVTQPGGTVTYTNLDIVRHDVVQDPQADGVAGPSTQPWCKRFPAGKCPLFWTPLLGLGDSITVKGTDKMKPGTYSFYCTLHPGMRGKLIVAG